jgi:hypothetical protein
VNELARPMNVPAVVAKFVLEHLTVPLQGKRYVTVAGATAVASAFGYSVREAEGGSRYVPATDDLPGYWECVAEVLDPAGVVIGRGTGMVSDDERPWSTRPHFARRAMASTRSAGRALRMCVGHLFVGLGNGVQAVTLEEMPEVEYEPPMPQKPSKDSTASLTFQGEDGGRFTGVLTKVWEPKPGTKRIGFEIQTQAGVVKLGSFQSKHLDDGRELAGSDVEVAWKRSKCGKFMNLEGLLPITKALPAPPAGDPDADVPF